MQGGSESPRHYPNANLEVTSPSQVWSRSGAFLAGMMRVLGKVCMLVLQVSDLKATAADVGMTRKTCALTLGTSPSQS